MRTSFTFIIVSICIAIAYGAIFKWAYPHVSVSVAYATIFALGGFITNGAVSAAARLVRARFRKKPHKAHKSRRPATAAAKTPPGPGDDASG